MTAPQGNDAVFAYGFENSDNIWQPANINKFIPAKSYEGFVADRPLERSENMDSAGQTLPGVNLQAVIGPKISFMPGVDDLPPLLAHMNQQWSFGGQLGGGSGPFPMTTRPRVPGDAANPKYVDSLVGTISDGDGFPVLVSGMRAQELKYKIDAGKLSMLQASFLACYDTYTDDASQLVGGTYTGKPIIRGHWDPTKTGPLKLKVTAAAAGGFDGTVKLTTAAYAGATTIQVKFGIWYRVQLDDASRLGINRYEDLWFCIPTATGVLQISQEWSFANARAVATPTYSTRNPLHAAGLDVVIDEGLSTEQQIYLHSIEVTRTKPLKGNFTNGSKYSRTSQKNGPWKVNISIDRDREDRTALLALISSKKISITTYAYGDPFASSGFDELWKSLYANCQVSKATRDVSTPNTLPEKIELEASRFGSTSIYTDTVNTSLSAI